MKNMSSRGNLWWVKPKYLHTVNFNSSGYFKFTVRATQAPSTMCVCSVGLNYAQVFTQHQIKYTSKSLPTSDPTNLENKLTLTSQCSQSLPSYVAPHLLTLWFPLPMMQQYCLTTQCLEYPVLFHLVWVQLACDVVKSCGRDPGSD